MLGFIKNLFGKGPEAKSTTTPEAPATPAAKPQPVSPAGAPPAAAAAPSGETITVTLKGIVDALPPELKGLVTTPPKEGATIKVSLQKVLDGLPKGSVKITYADLKAQAGGGFGGDASLDQTLVSVPLREVLSKVKPGQFSMRNDQKTIDVPDDIKPVFGTDGEKTPEPKPAPAAAAPTPAPAPAPAPVAAAPAPAPKPAPAPAPAVAAPTPAPAPAAEASAPIKSSMGLPDPASLRPAAAAPKPAPTPAPAPAPKPALTPTPAAATPKPAAPAAPAPAPAVAAAATGGTLSGTVESLSTSWPEDIKGELAKHNLPGLNLTVPLDLVEPMMRKGKILFTWPQLRGWITPALPASLGANRDAESLELPLKVIIPLFMAARKPGAQQKSVAVDTNIPDVFSGKMPAKPAAPAPSPAPSAPAPAPVAAAPAPAPAPAPTAPVTSSGPADLLAKAAALPNVAGVVIASPEGLKVASQLPPEFNADAFAGFVVAMFSRMNQFTGDLKLGEPKALTVQTSSRSLAIVKSGRTFLAVIGKPDAVLPVEDLKKLAATLS